VDDWARRLRAARLGPAGPRRALSPAVRGLRSGHRRRARGDRLRAAAPRHAATRTAIRGIDVISTFELRAPGGGTRLTQTVEAKGCGPKGRVLIPVIRPHLERKLEADLAALEALLA